VASELLAKWLRHYDPIHRGFTPAGIVNGVTATSGWSFPRMRGGYNLYRGGVAAGAGAGGGIGVAAPAAVDFDHPVGAAGRNATTIANAPWRPHQPSTVYLYTVKSIGGGGVESVAASPARAAEFDGAGALLGPRPNSPIAVSVRPGTGGTFVVRWAFAMRHGEVPPDHFALHHDDGTGEVDYDHVVAQVNYQRGRAHYTYASGAFSHGARRTWAVRAVTAAGVHDGNTRQVPGFADGSAPAAAAAVHLSRLEEEDGAAW
jgi:hypothetical protein